MPLPDHLLSLWWLLRRWTPKHAWYRLRLPLRRRRWRFQSERSATRMAKQPNALPSDGPALVFGAFDGIHGLGRAAAYDLQEVRRRHSHVITIDISAALRREPTHRVELETLVENVYFLCQPDTYWVIPDVVDPAIFHGAYRTGRWVWETPKFPNSWRFAEALVHRIWAPSQFCADTFEHALPVPVEIIPYPVVALQRPQWDMRSRLGINANVFLGVCIMDVYSCPDRKNPWDHIRAWKLAFGDNPDFTLVMKIRLGKRTKVVLSELTELIGNARNVRILTNDLSHEEIAALHHSADVYMSLHRSEGYGLNIMEALLLDKPVVATDYSANAEYGPSFPTYYGIPYAMVRYSDSWRHYEDNFDYAQPDLQVAAQTLRAIAELKFCTPTETTDIVSPTSYLPATEAP